MRDAPRAINPSAQATFCWLRSSSAQKSSFLGQDRKTKYLVSTIDVEGGAEATCHYAMSTRAIDSLDDWVSL